MKTPDRIPLAEAARLLWLDREQFLESMERIPFPVEVRDGVPHWSRNEILLWRRNGCPRLRWWYEGTELSMLSRVLKLKAELAASPYTGGAER